MSKKIDFLKNIASLNESEIKSKISEDESRLKKLKFAHAITPLQNPMSIRSLRKDVARLKSELKRRTIA